MSILQLAPPAAFQVITLGAPPATLVAEAGVVDVPGKAWES